MPRSLFFLARVRPAALPRLVGVTVVVALAVSGVATRATASTADGRQVCAGASGVGFYDPAPLQAGAGPGTTLRCRPAVWALTGAPARQAWDVVYASRDRLGRPIAVSGGIAVPTTPWAGKGVRPIVVVAPGSQGMGDGCAFSRQLDQGPVLEAPEIAAFLSAGYAVATTDYEGYLNGQVPTYMVGLSEAHSVLDAVRAGMHVAGLPLNSPIAIDGYSQGGQASLWAAQEASSYAPELHVVGDVSGSVPGDLVTTAHLLDGGLAAGFLGDAAIGAHAAYPELPFDQVLSPNGKAVVAALSQECFVETVLTHIGRRVSSYTTGGMTLDEFLDLAGPDGVTWRQALDQSTLGRNLNIGFPVAMYRGVVDEIVPNSTEDATRATYCSAGIHVAWKVYPGDHLLTIFEAIPDVLAYLAARFRGDPAPDNCP